MSDKPIYISTPKLKILKIRKQNNVRCFSILKVGDVIQFRAEFKKIQRYNNKLRPTYFEMFINGLPIVDDTLTEFIFSQNEIVRYLDYFEVEVIEQ